MGQPSVRKANFEGVSVDLDYDPRTQDISSSAGFLQLDQDNSITCVSTE